MHIYIYTPYIFLQIFTISIFNNTRRSCNNCKHTHAHTHTNSIKKTTVHKANSNSKKEETDIIPKVMGDFTLHLLQ